MSNITEFLKEQTLSGVNKRKRVPINKEWNVSKINESIPVRKATSLKMMLENMPLFIGEKELIVGTRTVFCPNEGNEDGNNIFQYDVDCGIPYINDKDIEFFGEDQSFLNKTHYTPDYSILLEKGLKGILEEVEKKEKDESLKKSNIDFLKSVKVAYKGLRKLILRYAEYALELSEKAVNSDKERLIDISRRCFKISYNKPDTFIEATQLLWFGHLVAMIESFQFVNYGRLDVILYKFLGKTPLNDAKQVVECLLMKMYDQADLETSYLEKYSAHLVVTLGGVLPNGNDAVNDVTFMFLDAINKIRLPDPEFNLRINSKNNPEFIKKAAKLSVSGCNNIAYFNDDIFIENLNGVGISIEDARSYGFDLCQDINIPGKSDFFATGQIMCIDILLKTLNDSSSLLTFEEVLNEFKMNLKNVIEKNILRFNKAQENVFNYKEEKYKEYLEGIRKKDISVDWFGRSPMAPLPYLSALYHNSINSAVDIIYESYPIKHKGLMLSSVVETINSLASIKKQVYDEKKYELSEVMNACKENFTGKNQEIMRYNLWNSPKWGNDDSYVDDIAKEILEFGLTESAKHKTFSGGIQLAGIHQPHTLIAGSLFGATPQGRLKGMPLTVTLTPESGTMKNGPTAALLSAVKIDYRLIHWNFCMMINFFESSFNYKDAYKVFLQLVLNYFKLNGLQFQANILNVENLKEAQNEPLKHRDLIVRLWGMSAYFVDLPKNIQNELIARFKE